MDINIIQSRNTVDFTKYINYLLVIHAFALPISKALVSITTVLLILLWVYEGDFKSKLNKLRDNLFIMALSSFILLNIIHALFSDNLFESLVYVKKYWHFIIVYIVFTSLNKEFIERIILAFLLAMLISEVMSYLIFFEVITYRNILPTDPSPFMSHIEYSIYLSFTSLILLNKFYYSENIKAKLLYILYFISTTSNLFINGGRTGQVAFILGIMIILFYNVQNKVRALFISTLLIVCIFTVAYNVSPVFKARVDLSLNSINLMINENNYNTSIGTRVGAIVVGSTIFYDNFLFGVGITNEMDLLEEYAEKLNVDTMILGIGGYHNIFIHYSVQLGVLGLLTLIFIFYALLKNKIFLQKYHILYLVFISHFFIIGCTHDAMYLMNSSTFIALFSGLFTTTLIYKEQS